MPEKMLKFVELDQQTPKKRKVKNSGERCAFGKYRQQNAPVG